MGIKERNSEVWGTSERSCETIMYKRNIYENVRNEKTYLWNYE